MKNLSRLVIAFVCLFAGVMSGQTTFPTTPNIGLELPSFGTLNWNIPINYNSSLLDSLLSGNAPLPALAVTGPLTAPQFTTWSRTASYNINATVFYLGQSYYSLTAGNMANLPTDPTNWGIGIGSGGAGTTGCGTTCLLTTNNLSDLTSASAARMNLGLGSAAQQDSSAFDAAGAAAAVASAASAAVTAGTTGQFSSYPGNGAIVGPNSHLSDSGTVITSTLPMVVNDSTSVSSITLGVGGATGPILTAASGTPSSCGSTYPVGSYDVNSAGVPGTLGYNCSGQALPQLQGALNQGQLNTSNIVGGTIYSGHSYATPFTLAAQSTINQCSFYLGHYSNSGHHIGCGIAAAPTTSTISTTLLCSNAYSEQSGPINGTVNLPLTGCGNLAAGNYWVFSFTDDTGYISLGLTNCGSSCTNSSYVGTLTYTSPGAPVITTSTMALGVTGIDFIESVQATPTGTPWLPTATAGVDINVNGQVVGLGGVPLTQLGTGPLGLDQNGAPRIMPLGDSVLSATSVFGNSTDYPSGRQIAAFVPVNAGIITSISIINTSLAGGSCTTAPTFNVFAGSNTGTAVLASATAQTTMGTITTQQESLGFGSGSVIGIFVSTQGATCLAPLYSVSMSYTEQ